MYYDNHVTVLPKKNSYIENGKNKEWDCFLCGELVGSIRFVSDRCDYKKPYEAMAFDENGRMRFAGWHDSMYEARIALLEPAREYLQKKRESRASHQAPAAALPESDCEFYPTPPEIAGKLLAAVDWNRVETILEPSAGRGDLLEYAIRRNGYRQGRDIDCIELDPNLRAILIGKGFRVVHDDFLDYHTRKRYNLILMNPPFADGDKHLLHGKPEVFHFLNGSTCGAEDETHTVREWLSEFDLQNSTAWFLAWQKAISRLSPSLKAMGKLLPPRELSMLYAIAFKALYLDYADVQEFLPKFVLNVQSLQKQIDTLIDKLMPGGNTHE